MNFPQTWLLLGFAIVTACGGTVTHVGDPDGTGGTTGEAGSAPNGGNAGTTPRGGDAGYAGDLIVAGGAGGWGGYGASGGVGGFGAFGNSGGDAGYAGVAGTGGSNCGYVRTMQASPLTFVFSTNTPVYVPEDCSPSYELQTCDGTPLAHDAGCVSDCTDPKAGCIACSGCALRNELITPDMPQHEYWSGETFTYGTLPGGCSCATSTPAASGVYTISVTTYLTEADAMNRTNGYPHQQTFNYPAPDGVVNVFLGFQPL